MAQYIGLEGGNLQDPSARTDCTFCAADSTNTFLASVNSFYDQRWRNFGILWAYIAFNVVAALFFYWVLRVPKKSKVEKAKKE